MLSARTLPSRYFTPQEANELIPTIRAFLLKIHEHTRTLLRIERELDALGPVPAREALLIQREERERGQTHLLERIEALGAELVDPLELGRVRFPAMRNGEPVWLLWNLGEAKVESWTPMGGQLFGPRPLAGTVPVRWEWRN
ncbi:MAG: DUF2203 family protein [Myxococcota bacterium]